jgi:hypothetical protein
LPIIEAADVGLRRREEIGHLGVGDRRMRETLQRRELLGPPLGPAYGHHRLSVPTEDPGRVLEHRRLGEALLQAGIGRRIRHHLVS